MEKLLELKNILVEKNCSCVVESNGNIYVSFEKGIKPVLGWLAENNLLKGASVADKVVGKAAALLFAYAGIKEIYAEILSQPAKMVFDKHNIPVSYLKLVKNIRNRNNTDICPMEKMAADINSPELAFKVFSSL
ncbi:MAG TPA: DUF1893 domain-containing protein [Clostridiales bacterium]|nr:DUF1893 domain-containing protein [Clostridiales bacterium]